MPVLEFNRDRLAKWYAREHLKTDPAIAAVYYLPEGAGERELRFVEINRLIGDRIEDPLVPIDFGVDLGTDNAHQLLVLDVTPAQWKRLETNRLRLPDGWSLKNAVRFSSKPNE
jgi:hypothetical protein